MAFQKTDVFQLLDGRLELSFELSVVVPTAQANVFAGKAAKLKLQRIRVKEPLVEETICLPRGREFQAEVGFQVESFQVICPETCENHRIPAERGTEVTAAHGPPVEVDGLQNVERPALPTATLAVPPRLVVIERHVGPATKPFVDTPVRFPALVPASRLEQFEPREFDGPFAESVSHVGELDQHKQQVAVGRRGKSEGPCTRSRLDDHPGQHGRPGKAGCCPAWL